MNILPHKSWHVRTKKNIDRVRRDQAKAAAEEKETQRRVQLAAQEARTSFLRQRAQTRHGAAETSDFDRYTNTEKSNSESLKADANVSCEGTDGHVNFFQQLEQGNRDSLVQHNAEHEAEKKAEQETHEKKIGLLVYLGQDAQENSKDKPWFQSLHRNVGAPNCEDSGANGVNITEKEKSSQELRESRRKELQDPLGNIRKYLNTTGVKSLQSQQSKSKIPESSRSVPVPKTSEKLKEESRSSKSKKRKHKHRKSEKSSNISKHSKKHKHRKSSKKHTKVSDSSESSEAEEDSYEVQKAKKLEALRAERLEREREERRKAEKLLATLRGEMDPDSSVAATASDSQKSKNSAAASDGPTNRSHSPKMKQKYNAQFNPYLARQNYD